MRERDRENNILQYFRLRIVGSELGVKVPCFVLFLLIKPFVILPEDGTFYSLKYITLLTRFYTLQKGPVKMDIPVIILQRMVVYTEILK